MSCLSGGSGNNGSAQKKQKMSSSPGAHGQQQQHYHHGNQQQQNNSMYNNAHVQQQQQNSNAYTRNTPMGTGVTSPGGSSGDKLNFHTGASYSPGTSYMNGYAQTGHHGQLQQQSSGSSNRLSNGHISNGFGPTSGHYSPANCSAGSSLSVNMAGSVNSRISPQHSRVPSQTSSNKASPPGSGTNHTGGLYMAAAAQVQQQALCEYPKGNSVSCYDMCVYCFDVLVNRLKHDQVPRVSTPTFAHANESFPLFVTWKNQDTPESKAVLRGCIGTFTDTKLHKGLHDYALSSALKDSRFAPISDDEISKLVVSVSVLLHFEGADSWDDWEIGLHGLRLEIETDRGQKKTATYLPEVASEQRWTKKQTIDSLLHKSGYTGRINSDVRNRIKLTRYKSEKVTLSYAEYRDRKAYKLQLKNNPPQSLVLTNGVSNAQSSDDSPMRNHHQMVNGSAASLVSPTSSGANSPMKALSINPTKTSHNQQASSSSNWGSSGVGGQQQSSSGGTYRRSGGGASPRHGGGQRGSMSDSHPL